MLLVTQLVGDPGPSSSAREVALQMSGSDSPDSGDALQEQILLTAIVHLSDDDFRELEAMNAEYQEKRPAIHVDIANYTPEDAYSYLREHARIGDNPDIMLLDYIWVNEFAAAGYLSHQLESYIKVKNGNLDQFLHWNNYVWADPYQSDPYIAVVNERVLKDETTGLIPGSLEEWTAYQQRRMAEEAEADEPADGREQPAADEEEGVQPAAGSAADGIIYVSPDDPYAFISLTWMLGEQWERTGNGMYRIAGDGDSLMRQLFGNEARQDGEGEDASSKTEPTDPLLYRQNLTVDQMWERFDAGLLPVLIMRQSELHIRRPRMIEYRYSLVQSDQERRGGWVHGTSFAVSATSRHAEEAFQWIDAMTSGMRRADPANVIGQSFQSDPELTKKLEVIGTHIRNVFEEAETADGWNQRLLDSWDQRAR